MMAEILAREMSARFAAVWVVVAVGAVFAAISLRRPMAELYGHRRLLKNFVVRDLKVRYVGSSIGFFWSVIFPFVNLCVYMFVFRLILRVRWSDTANATQAAMYMLVGILCWTAFSETVIRSTNALVENANLIKKVVFPSEILPAYLTLSSLVNMAIGIPVVLAGVLFFDTSSEGFGFRTDFSRLGPSLLILPVLMALQAVFTVGLGFLLSTVNVFLRDIHQIIGVGVMVWMFATPIFYPDTLVANKGYGWILAFNPMYWLIEAYRDVLLERSWPEFEPMLRLFAVGLIVLGVGVSVFRRHKSRFPDLL